MKFSGCCFYMYTSIDRNFQNCVSVPLMHMSLHLIWFHETHTKYVKRKPPHYYWKKWIQKRIKFSICYWEITYYLKQNIKRKWSVWVKPWLKNSMHTRYVHDIFFEDFHEIWNFWKSIFGIFSIVKDFYWICFHAWLILLF